METSLAMEESGKGSERDEIEVISTSPIGPEADEEDSSTESILSAVTNSVPPTETSCPGTGLHLTSLRLQ